MVRRKGLLYYLGSTWSGWSILADLACFSLISCRALSAFVAHISHHALKVHEVAIFKIKVPPQPPDRPPTQLASSDVFSA